MYQRLAEKGRLLPEGMQYINSRINNAITVCYKVMEADSADKLHAWIAHWKDLADFEVIPVTSSAAAKQIVMT